MPLVFTGILLPVVLRSCEDGESYQGLGPCRIYSVYGGEIWEWHDLEVEDDASSRDILTSFTISFLSSKCSHHSP